ncbi:MAG: oxidative damage protection protein [Gammaproteobacteria bacterium]|nr:oxidative damage protection protein [Gammaproteobacteria bacterium]
MTRTVHCRKYNKELPGLPVPPYPGAKGQQLYETVSQQAWSEWLQQQTMLINEKHLSLADPEHRKYLQAEMDKFLNNEEFDQAEGYVPEE